MSLREKALNDWAKTQGDYDSWEDFASDNEGHLTDDQAKDLANFIFNIVFDFADKKEKEGEHDG